MGLIRVFKKSVRFTFRNKIRFIAFLMLFAIISTLVAFFVDDLDALQTDELLIQKGVSATELSEFSVNYEQGTKLYDDVLDYSTQTLEVSIENSAIYYYSDLDDYIRINTFDIENPWMSPFVTPNLLISGRFPEASNEILIPENSIQTRNSTFGDLLIKTDMVVGQTITFEKDGFDSLEYLIVGTFQLSKHNNQNNDRLWIFTDGSQLEPLMNIFSRTTADVYTYMLSFTVEGQILQDETHQQMQILSSKISELITEEIYGDWKIQPSSHPDEQTVTQARQILLNLGIWIVGGAIISILFAWIISRFRRREVAILKSMGYSNRHVRSTLIAEILTISFLGFVFGIGSTQSYLFYLSDFSVGAILRWQAALWSFVIMVVITIPGMVLASLRVLRISPAEAFRQN